MAGFMSAAKFIMNKMHGKKKGGRLGSSLSDYIPSAISSVLNAIGGIPSTHTSFWYTRTDDEA